MALYSAAVNWLQLNLLLAIKQRDAVYHTPAHGKNQRDVTSEHIPVLIE